MSKAPSRRGLDTKMLSSRKIVSRENTVKLHTKNRKAIQGRILEFDGAFTPPNFPKTKSDAAFLNKALKENFVFSDISTKEKIMLLKAFQKDVYKPNDIIIKQGDIGDFFYVCEAGTVTFIANDKVVGNCGRGGSFGELALLYDSPRAATCKAATDVTLWKVDQGTFRHLMARAAREEESSIMGVLSKVPMLKDLDHALVSKFATVLTPVKFAEGEKIVKKGETGDVFYIIKDGQVRVHDIGLGDAKYADQILRSGDWFGERALMTGEPRAANVTAMAETNALAIDRDTFETTIGSLESILGHESKKRAIMSVPIFAKSKLLSIDYDNLVKHLKETKFQKGDKLAEAGVPRNQDFYIIKEGSFKVTGVKDAVLGSGGYFGDRDIKERPGTPCEETCVCKEDSVCWVLTKADLVSVIGSVKNLGKRVSKRSSTIVDTIGLTDLKKHRILGLGAFGRVWLVTTKYQKTKAYALKTISKRQLLEANQVKGVIREKRIMESIDNPFVLGLVSAFQDENTLFLLLPLIQGGELFNIIHTDTKDGISNDSAMFYAACILQALGHLHERNIAYRDMKPENALIDKEGYCVMVDLGFAKTVADKTYTLCGTPEYLAPEIIMSKGHDKAVDYWSFGVLIYEMVVGNSPFYADGPGGGMDQVSLFKRIVKGQFTCPVHMSDEAADIVKKLLNRRQGSRLGNLSRGHHDVEDHPWFASMDWEKLNNFELKAPWVPTIKDPLDSSNFDDFSTEERQVDRSLPLNASEQSVFDLFTEDYEEGDERGQVGGVQGGQDTWSFGDIDGQTILIVFIVFLGLVSAAYQDQILEMIL